MCAMYDGFAPFYDVEYGQKYDDLEFYLHVAREVGSPILEIGAGTGRITFPLVNKGHTVTGIDNSAAMIELAEQKRKKLGHIEQEHVEFKHQDMRNFDLGREFALCIIPFRAFLHNLTIDEQIATLDCIYNHLQADGILAFDLFVPLYTMLSKGEWSESYSADELSAQASLTVTSTVEHDPVNQMLNINNQYQSGNDVTERQMQYRYIFRYEMELLLNMSGFAVEQVWGGFEGQEYDFNSGLMVFTASKQSD